MTPADAKKKCPHCNDTLKTLQVPPSNFSDGLGFGSELLLVCFNNECPLYVKGWNTMYDRYGQVGSMRYWLNPLDGDSGAFPVAHKEAMRGDIIED
ncbi:MAG: hypothetical protein HQL82_05750 [Magnetococcales bacterium]|nr:hypothetical protein [Magnetococcales bacterium]